MREPTIPTEPTIPDGVDTEVDEEQTPEEEKKGGRPSNKLLSADNKRLLAENNRLRDLVAMVAGIPDEHGRPDDFVLFELRRHGQTLKVTNGAVRHARKLLAR